MKQYRSLLILAALAVALAGAYFWMTANPEVEATGLLFELERGESITGVEITNPYGGFSFAPVEDDRWSVITDDGETYRVNAEKMKLMLAALNAVPISRVLEEELPEYGFAVPQASVTCTTSAGRSHRFTVGAETASRSDVYLRDADGKIMITSKATVAQLVGSLAAYRDKEIFVIDKESIRGISYYKDSQLVLTVGNNGPQDWFMTYPFEAPARQIELNELTAVMKKWKTAGYPDTDDYAAMGLDNPTEWLEITDGAGQTQRIELGASDGTTTYVRTGDDGEVALLYTTDLDFSMLTPNAIVFVAPLKTTVDQLSSIRIQTAEEDILFEVEQTGVGQKIICGDREISANNFSSVFFKYLAMNADGYDPATLQGNPVARMTTVFVDGSSVELALYPRDESTYYMSIDGGSAEYYLATDDLVQLLYRAHQALGQS